MQDKIYSMLGLATKARKLVSGDETCEKSIKSLKAFVVIIAEDASDNTKKKFEDMCKYRNIQIRNFGQKDLIGKFIGKDVRAVVVIQDQNFATRIIELIDVAKELEGGVAVGEN